ncbi:MAG: hypothetical protein KBD90_00410 [Alphaproteobacteria bacterium]|nr:hypothetical protein [Alphaproteobacteria bacterium]
MNLDSKEIKNFYNLLKESGLVDETELHLKVDLDTSLIAIAAIDKANKGPALGGTRCIHYASIKDAIIDALKLSKTMTRKIQFADLPFTGGKVVLVKPDKISNKKEYFSAYGKFIDSLDGRIITGCDSGVTQEDMKIATEYTKYITALPSANSDLDSLAYLTAFGVQEAMRAAIQFKFGKDNLKNIKIVIQGVGKVGAELVAILCEHGADLTVTDTDSKKLSLIYSQYNVRSVDPDKIYQIESDVFAPCGLGGTINSKTIPSLKDKIICGAANNPLASEDISQYFDKLGILYVPDFIANIGGTVYAALSYQGHSSEQAKDWLSKFLYQKTLQSLHHRDCYNHIYTAA